MPVEWFSASKTMPTVTLAPYGFNLNSSAIDYFKGVKKVRLGLDAEKKQIAIKAATEGEEGAFGFPKISEKTKTARISCSDFIKFISVRLGEGVDVNGKYAAVWEDKEKTLVIYLSNKLQRRTRKKAAS